MAKSVGEYQYRCPGGSVYATNQWHEMLHTAVGCPLPTRAIPDQRRSDIYVRTKSSIGALHGMKCLEFAFGVACRLSPECQVIAEQFSTGFARAPRVDWQCDRSGLSCSTGCNKVVCNMVEAGVLSSSFQVSWVQRRQGG